MYEVLPRGLCLQQDAGEGQCEDAATLLLSACHVNRVITIAAVELWEPSFLEAEERCQCPVVL